MRKYGFILLLVCWNLMARSRVPNRSALFATTYDESRYSYYDAIIEQAIQRHWAINASFNYSMNDGAFDCAGCSVPLARLLFGKDTVSIQDISLFSKLSNDNKVRINNCAARARQRGAVPIGALGVPFGGFRDDLYTTLLAPIQLIFEAQQREMSFPFSALFRYDFGANHNFSWTLGVTLPFASKEHDFEISYVGGELFRTAYTSDTTSRETTLNEFFRNFSSVEDFIMRAVLAPKDLTLLAHQRASGVGDISVFTIFEYHDVNSIECGVNIIFPTAGSGKGCTVWEPILGNGGAFQVSPFYTVVVKYVVSLLKSVWASCSRMEPCFYE